VDYLSTNYRAVAVAAAAAHDFNNELTVILSSVTAALAALDPGHPSRVLLLDIQAAGQRCVWKASALLSFSARMSLEPVRASLEYLVDE
jgi:hypothetical protein